MSGGPGPIALVGSGEYLPSMLEVERGLLQGRAPRYVQIATAAAPEGDASLERWHRLGAEQAKRMLFSGQLLDADEAHRIGLVELLAGGPPCIKDAIVAASRHSTKAAKGTIRGDFGVTVMQNIAHASDTLENAAIELKRFFKPEELFDYSMTLSK